MVSTIPTRHVGRLLAALIAAAALGACSGPPSNKTAGPLGFGTPGVSSVMQESPAATLREELDRCSRVQRTRAASQTQGMPAACAQLERTARNQPGNTVW